MDASLDKNVGTQIRSETPATAKKREKNLGACELRNSGWSKWPFSCAVLHVLVTSLTGRRGTRSARIEIKLASWFGSSFKIYSSDGWYLNDTFTLVR